jgi:release factor glutamine methyltransferase
MTTIREAFVRASSFLGEHGVDENKRIAELLLQHVLGMDRTELFMQWDCPFPLEKLGPWDEALARKASGEPLQYITGEQEFYGISFRVNPAVLIPRPETEILVEQIMEQSKRLWNDIDKSGSKQQPWRSPADRVPEKQPLHGFAENGPDQQLSAADIGTGSGAIAVTLALHNPRWEIWASDISTSALQTAESNAASQGVEDQITFLQGDCLEPFIKDQIRLDILVSNPPYIESKDIPGLQREVRGYEPHSALDGGEDGLLFYRSIVSQLSLLPEIPRLLGFEVGQGQATAVRDILSAVYDKDRIMIVKDLAGIERHVIARR